MILSQVNLALCLGVILLTWPATLHGCRHTNRKREDRGLKECLSHWNILTDTNVVDLQKTLFDANLTHVCRTNAIDSAEQCVTTVPVDKCPSVLLFWHHLIGPVNQACENTKDFTNSLACIDKKRLTLCQGITHSIGPYSRRRRDNERNCEAISSYQTCMNQILQKDPGCEDDAVKPLVNAVGLHLLHLGVYYECAQDYPFTLPPEDTLKGLPYDTPLGFGSDFFD
ncbi:uncharacterized protein LOC133175884 [Saccostrea echinata]|uniref:uncharacterized protein LOC133175884 n=1 Tax=Saccostrea echinata TaxID=191078 RepID=UPI002A80B7CC|nr:uncharacterized protein LOC133175884 [Saccostrea echinata]